MDRSRRTAPGRQTVFGGCSGSGADQFRQDQLALVWLIA
jgi:hypothetical protein